MIWLKKNLPSSVCHSGESLQSHPKWDLTFEMKAPLEVVCWVWNMGPERQVAMGSYSLLLFLFVPGGSAQRWRRSSLSSGCGDITPSARIDPWNSWMRNIHEEVMLSSKPFQCLGATHGGQAPSCTGAAKSLAACLCWGRRQRTPCRIQGCGPKNITKQGWGMFPCRIQGHLHFWLEQQHSGAAQSRGLGHCMQQPQLCGF